MAEHPFIPLSWLETSAEIDLEIAPLILELWKAGMETCNSCQENQPGVMWIQFENLSDLLALMSISAPKYDPDLDSLYNRIRKQWRTLDGQFSTGTWTFDLIPVDYSINQEFDSEDCITETQDGSSEFRFFVSVRFPISDYPILLERMTDWNKKYFQKFGGYRSELISNPAKFGVGQKPQKEQES